MKKIIGFMVTACLLTLIGCGSSSSSTPVSSVTVTFAPVADATNQAVDVAVTAVFSAAITAPADWTTAFTLLASGGTETACTAVSYDADTLTATCTHDDLTGMTEYASSIIGVTDSAGVAIATTTAIFTTIHNASFTSKTSVTTIAGDVGISIVFTFDTAPSATPTIAVADASADLSASESVDDDLSLAISPGECTPSESDALVYTCTVTGVAGCRTVTDYTATISVGEIAVGTLTFNSADDEFDSSATLSPTIDDSSSGYCWDQLTATLGGEAATISEGNLAMPFTSGVGVRYIAKELSGLSDFSVMYYISSNNAPAEGNTALVNTRLIKDPVNSPGNDYLDVNAGLYQDNLAWAPVNSANADDNIDSLEVRTDGALADTVHAHEDFFVCQVRKDGVINTYVKFPNVESASSFTKITLDNMAQSYHFGDGGPEDVVDSTQLTEATLWTEIRSTNDVNTTYLPKIGYVRYKTTGITGENATDCPTWTAN